MAHVSSQLCTRPYSCARGAARSGSSNSCMVGAARPYFVRTILGVATEYGCIDLSNEVRCCQDDKRRSVPHSEAHDATATATVQYSSKCSVIMPGTCTRSTPLDRECSVWKFGNAPRPTLP